MVPKKQGLGALFGRALLRLVLILALAPFAAWGVLAFVFGSWPRPIDLSLAVLYALGSAAALLLLSTRRALAVFAALFALPLACFFLMRPSHDRVWQPDVALLPYSEITGKNVVLHNVRNCDYRSETNYVVRYETRSYDLTRLRSADVLFSDWGLGKVAHTMLSFGFEDGQYICLSIETRKEVGEDYSALKGFFRQYELICVAADERDLVGLRTNFRKGETVSLYRLKPKSMSNARDLLLDYLQRMNRLRERPVWYNALTANCMTGAFRIARRHAGPGRGQWHWSVFLNGYAARHFYDNGVIDTSLPFDELQRRSRVNDRALAAGNALDFSARIREGVPGMDWRPDGRE
jgi:hypothetical protein